VLSRVGKANTGPEDTLRFDARKHVVGEAETVRILDRSRRRDKIRATFSSANQRLQDLKV
jgi:hypothetical protein